MMSLVYRYGEDAFRPWIAPQPTTLPSPLAPLPAWPWEQPKPAPLNHDDLAKFEKLVDEFRELLKAAERFDRETGQPDCVDPAKAQLMQDIERRMAEMRAGR